MQKTCGGQGVLRSALEKAQLTECRDGGGVLIEMSALLSKGKSSQTSALIAELCQSDLCIAEVGPRKSRSQHRVRALSAVGAMSENLRFESRQTQSPEFARGDLAKMPTSPVLYFVMCLETMRLISNMSTGCVVPRTAPNFWSGLILRFSVSCCNL